MPNSIGLPGSNAAAASEQGWEGEQKELDVRQRWEFKVTEQ